MADLQEISQTLARIAPKPSTDRTSVLPGSGTISTKQAKKLSPTPRQKSAQGTSLWQRKAAAASPDAQPDVCEHCRGNGWVVLDRPLGHPEFGKAKPCVCKEAAIAAARAAKLDAIDGLTYEERAYRFGEERNSQQKRAAAVLMAAVDDGYGMVTLRGGYGTGKTFMLIAAVNRAKAAGMAAHYTTMHGLLAYLKKAFDPKSAGDDTLSKRWDLLTSAPILAIDEVDKFNATPWATEQFMELIDIRWRNLRTAVTAIAMNGSMSQLPGNVEDRLRDGRAHIITLTGGSMRPLL